MSSNLLLCSDVGFENESRIKLGASSVPGHAANSVLYSGLMGGDSCHLKQNRKQRPDGRYNSIGDGLETSIRWAYAEVFTFFSYLKFWNLKKFVYFCNVNVQTLEQCATSMQIVSSKQCSSSFEPFTEHVVLVHYFRVCNIA